MTEEHLIPLAQHIHIGLAVPCIGETVLGALAMTEKIVVAALALHGQGIALVTAETLLLIAAVHVGKLSSHDVAEEVLGIDEVVA